MRTYEWRYVNHGRVLHALEPDWDLTLQSEPPSLCGKLTEAWYGGEDSDVKEIQRAQIMPRCELCVNETHRIQLRTCPLCKELHEFCLMLGQRCVLPDCNNPHHRGPR